MTKWNWRLVTGLTCVAACVAMASPLGAQSREERERNEAMVREAGPLIEAVNVLQSEGAPATRTFMVDPRELNRGNVENAIKPASGAPEVQVAWRRDFMRGPSQGVYVPYTLEIPADAFPGPVSVYVRVVANGAAAAAPAANAPKDAAPTYAYEDFFSIETRPPAGQPLRIIRALGAPAGSYDVYYGVRAKMANPRRDETAPVKVVATKQSETFPDFWTGELLISSVVVTNKVEQIQQAVTPEMQRERPYLFGQTEFVPLPDNRFAKNDELSVVFQIYNPALQAGKPNVTIEYSFHQRLPEGEKYFNKTNPQQMNAQTLPPTFDVAATQMLPSGQSVPLASFPAGDYRMEIKVTDGHANKVITRNVMFTVLGA
jgi:hypothetical protein